MIDAQEQSKETVSMNDVGEAISPLVGDKKSVIRSLKGALRFSYRRKMEASSSLCMRALTSGELTE